MPSRPGAAACDGHRSDQQAHRRSGRCACKGGAHAGQPGQERTAKGRARHRRDGVRMLRSRSAADMQERRCRVRPVRHGAHRLRLRIAEDPARALPRTGHRADGARSARRISLHRPRPRHRRIRRHGADGGDARRGRIHRLVLALPAAGTPRRGIRICARRLPGRRRRRQDGCAAPAHDDDRADRDRRRSRQRRGDRRGARRRRAVDRPVRPDQLPRHSGAIQSSAISRRGRSRRSPPARRTARRRRCWPPTTPGRATTPPRVFG